MHLENHIEMVDCVAEALVPEIMRAVAKKKAIKNLTVTILFFISCMLSAKTAVDVAH